MSECTTEEPLVRPSKSQHSQKSHIWAVILPYLRNPRPLPLSYPPRSALRQTHLGVALQVCQDWASICKPLLYRDVTTDDFPLLVQHIHQPAMQARFANTRSLHIEYSPKGYEGGYDRLLNDSEGNMWPAIGVTEMEMAEVMINQCHTETRDITRALNELLGLNPSLIFPQLQSIAVSSIYGSRSRAYTFFDAGDTAKIHPSEPAVVVDVQVKFEKFLARVGVNSYCTRETNGPLSIPSVSYASDYDSSLSSSCVRTQHFNIRTPRYPIPFGLPIRWCSDEPQSLQFSQAVQGIIHWVLQHIKLRKEAQRLYGINQDVVDLTVYCSTGFWAINHPETGEPMTVVLTEADQEEKAKILGTALQKSLRDSSGLEDVVRFHPWSKTPTCPACGGGAPT